MLQSILKFFFPTFAEEKEPEKEAPKKRGRPRKNKK